MRFRSARRLAALLFVIGCQGSGPEPVALTPQPIAQAPTPVETKPTFAAQTQAPLQIAMGEIEPPFSLTATDGSGLELTRIDAKAVVQGPLAFTELHLYFKNPEARIREGTFAITLPQRAAISRFAMENNGTWMEAEVVEKQLARRAYEDFLHRKQDPALLEKALGNQFTARVFPIPANGEKHLVLSFSQELPGERYALPLRGLPSVGKVDVALQMMTPDGTVEEQTQHETNWKPDKDFIAKATVAAEAIGADNVVAAQVMVTDQSGAATVPDLPQALTLLVDTSASRGLGFGGMVERLDSFIAKLGPTMPIQVVAFDQDTQAIYSGPASGWSAAQAQALRERGAAGASDLGQALAWLGQNAPKHRVMVITDGVVTAGQEATDLVAMAKQLPGVDRIDIALAGGIRDDAMASTLARAAKHAGGVLDFDGATDGLVAAIGERMLVDVSVAIEGAQWSYPRVLPSARVGTRVMVYAKVKPGTKTLTATVNGAKRTLQVVGGTPALVSRATAAAEIDEMEQTLLTAEGDVAKQLRTNIAKKSVAARVVSSQTSLLVLESDSDYARYGIERTALADILEVTPDGIVMRHRAAPSPQVVKTPPPPRPKAKREAPGKADKQVSANESARPRGARDQDDRAPMDGDVGLDDLKKELEESSADSFAGSAAGAPADMPPAPPPPPPPGATSPATRSPDMAPPRPEPARRITRPSDQVVTEESEIANERRSISQRQVPEWPPADAKPALTGELAQIMKAIKKGKSDDAVAKAKAWHAKEPQNVLALIGYGDALEAAQDLPRAARIYGSIIDLFPARADLRRFAGERLERVGAKLGASAQLLAIDTYKHSVADRPDHMTGHRLLAYAYLRAGKHAEAFAAIMAGLARDYPSGRFNGGERVLSDDAGLIGAAYAAAVPAQRSEIQAELQKHGLTMSVRASTRFILYWETDANDVDFHIQDGEGNHAYYSNPQLASGGELYADVTTGYGPECFAIPGKASSGPYHLSLHYYSQGPMGYGMGLLQIVKHDGKGTITIEDRPYVIMNDHAYVDLGTVK